MQCRIWHFIVMFIVALCVTQVEQQYERRRERERFIENACLIETQASQQLALRTVQFLKEFHVRDELLHLWCPFCKKEQWSPFFLHRRRPFCHGLQDTEYARREGKSDVYQGQRCELIRLSPGCEQEIH